MACALVASASAQELRLLVSFWPVGSRQTSHCRVPSPFSLPVVEAPMAAVGRLRGALYRPQCPGSSSGTCRPARLLSAFLPLGLLDPADGAQSLFLVGLEAALAERWPRRTPALLLLCPGGAGWRRL